MMSIEDRHERHLMRQRGAGARELKTATFGFSFSSFPPSLPPLTTATARSPRKSPTKSPQKSLKKASPQKASPEKKPDTALPSQQSLPIIETSTSEPSQKLQSSKRKRPAAETGAGNGTARSSKRRKVVDVPVPKSDEIIQNDGSEANDLHELDANTVVTQTKAVKRGRPAKEKKEIVKRQRITKNKKTSNEGISDGGIDPVVASNDHVEAIQESPKHHIESNKELITSEQLSQEQPIPNVLKRLAKRKPAAKTAGATTSPKDQQTGQEKSNATEGQNHNVEKYKVRICRRERAAPRSAESEGEEDSLPKKKKKNIKETKAPFDTSSKSIDTQYEKKAEINHANGSEQKSPRVEPADTAKDVPKRRGRPPKKAVPSPVETELLSQAKKATKMRKVQSESEPLRDILQLLTSADKSSKLAETDKSVAEPSQEALTEAEQDLRIHSTTTESHPKRRGRPPKVNTQAAPISENESASATGPVPTEATPDLEILGTKPRKGMPAKTATKPKPATTKAAFAVTEKLIPTISETSRAGETSSETVPAATAPKRRGRPPTNQSAQEVIVKAAAPDKKKTAKSSRGDGRLDVFTMRPVRTQHDADAGETKPSTRSKRGKSRKAEAKTVEQAEEEEAQKEVVVEEKLDTGITGDRVSHSKFVKTAKRSENVLPLAHPPEDEGGPQSKQGQSLTVQPPVLTARSTNLLVSPRRTRTTKHKLPMFRMTSKRKAQGEWQKEDWFEPRVPSTLLGRGP